MGSVSGDSAINVGAINIGIPPEQLEGLVRPYRALSETQEKLIAELKDKLDLNQRQVRAALEIAGEKDIPPEGLAAKLVEIAERFKALQAEALAQPGDDAKAAALKAEAQKAIEAGDLAKADTILEDVRKTAQSFKAYGVVLLPPGFSTDILDKSATEIEKLRKENKDVPRLFVRRMLSALRALRSKG